MPVPDLGGVLFRSLGLEQLRSSRHWLNRVAIEMVYGCSANFQASASSTCPRGLNYGPAVSCLSFTSQSSSFDAF